MTFSAEDQKENVELAFRLLMAELGDKSIAKTFFDPSCQPFTAIYQTTWKELSDQGWADEIQLRSRTCYRLKGAGWIEGQWRTGESRGESLTQRMRRLAAVLKGHVKGRKQDVVIMLDDLVQESDLPEGWLFNAIESNLLRRLWNRRDATWEERGTLVRIPLNFGMKLLDHTADIRAQLEEVREELGAAKDQLREFTCSFCGAPVVAQGPVPVSEHDEGYFMEYACGRVDTDAGGERACRLDPRFPKLEEYEFVLKENPNESSLKWACFAFAKTPNARRLDLGFRYGRTEEEARQRLIDRYQTYARGE